jgi:hypothetical protein
VASRASDGSSLWPLTVTEARLRMRLAKSLETNRRRASRFDATGFMTTMRQESLTPFAAAVGQL